MEESTSVIFGSSLPVALSGSLRRVYLPSREFFQLSAEGLAEPRTTGMFSMIPRITDRSRPLYLGMDPCL